MRQFLIITLLACAVSCALSHHSTPLTPSPPSPSAGRDDPPPQPPIDNAILILKGVGDHYTFCFEVTPEMMFANPGLMTRVVCGPTVGILRTYVARQMVARR